MLHCLGPERKLVSSMPGSPKKRRRREASERAETVAEPVQRAGTHDAPAPPRARAPASAPGRAQRDVVDRMAAQQLQELANVLQPGVLVDIERVRPRWCAGSLETYELDDGNVRELWDYIREECGGERYTLTVLHPNGQPAFVTTMRVPGPPRHEGERVTRREWRTLINGEPETEPATAQAPAVGAQGQWGFMETLLGPQGIMQAVLTENGRSGASQMASVEKLTTETRETIKDLVTAVGLQANQAREANSLMGQLEEFRTTMGVFQSVKDELTPEAPDAPEESDGMLKTARELFVKKVMMSLDKSGDDRPEKPRKRRPQNGRGAGDASGIPDAVSGGHGPN